VVNINKRFRGAVVTVTSFFNTAEISEIASYFIIVPLYKSFNLNIYMPFLDHSTNDASFSKNLTHRNWVACSLIFN
jgi:hypothetical protein